VGLGLALAVAAAAIKHHNYTSTAAVAVTPTSPQQDANNANGRTQEVINLDTEAQIVKSDAVAARVRRALHASAPLATIERRASVVVPPNTTVLRISYTAGSPRHAAAGADAFANAYLAVRASLANSVLQSQEAAVRNQMTSVENELKAQASQTGGTTAQGSLRALRYKALAAESAALAKQLSALSTTVISPGTVISGASAPVGSRSRTALLFVLSGLMIGLLLGAFGAVARDRTDPTLREPRQLEDAGVDVVGLVDNSGNSARTYRRAASAIVGSAASGGVLVAGPGWASHSNEAGLKLAAAIRDLGHRVALVRVANGTAEMTRLSASTDGAEADGAPDSPEISAALAAATRSTLRQGVERLKQDADFVVVDAADPLAEAVLPACKTALLVASINATRIDDVVDAVREMEELGVRVVGAIVLDTPVAADARRTAFTRRSPTREPSDSPSSSAAAPPTRGSSAARNSAPPARSRVVQADSGRPRQANTGSRTVGDRLQANAQPQEPRRRQDLGVEEAERASKQAVQSIAPQPKQTKQAAKKKA
jgi:capsular polysaccharide biosynthesis protein